VPNFAWRKGNVMLFQVICRMSKNEKKEAGIKGPLASVAYVYHHLQERTEQEQTKVT